MSQRTENNQAESTGGNRSFPKIGDLLIERRLIRPEQLEAALSYQKTTRPNWLLGRVLVELQLVSAEDLSATLAEASGIAFVRLTPAMVDPHAIRALPRKFIENHGALPISLTDDLLTVAMADFTNIFMIEDVERLSGHSVKIVAATDENIRETIEACTDDAAEFAFDEIMDEMADGGLTVVEKRDDELEDLENAASDSPVIKLVNHIIHGAVREKASDIHLEPDDGVFLVRYRIDGDLTEKLRPPFGLVPAVVSRIKIMAGMDIAERRVPQDGAITVILDRRPIDLRVSTLPTKFGEKVVIRIVDNKGAALDLETLGLSDSMLVGARDLIAEKNGVILVTGPTGSGKSTTLYACLAEIMNPKVNVSTIEDPIEYNLHGVAQSQTNDKAGFTFARALRALLRQDPDVIMVGEIRDNETAHIAVQSALTGHLVLSTLHTNDAPSAVTRLFNMEVEPYLVAASLRGILAQRLVRRICGHCKEPTEISDRTRRSLHNMFGPELPVTEFFRGRGCARCRETGHAGRVGVYELFVPDEETLEAISLGASLQEIRRLAGTGSGYTSLRDDGIVKVRSGVTTIEALLEVVARKSRARRPAPESSEGTWYSPSRADDRGPQSDVASPSGE